MSEGSPETREDEIPELRDSHCCDLGLEAAASLHSLDTRARGEPVPPLCSTPSGWFYSFRMPPDDSVPGAAPGAPSALIPLPAKDQQRSGAARRW